MEKKINIAEILRDMPKGIKLYSLLFGKCELIGVDNSIYPINIRTHNTTDTRYESLTEYGCYFSDFEDTDTVLFPSARMRDWSKFFKRGDVLIGSDLETAVVFDGWTNDDYTEFNTTINHYKISDAWGKGDICCTLLFRKVTDEERAKFIAAAEKHYGGKYNPETLQVEPVKVVEPKCPFEPFQKVLVRDFCDEKWKADYFSHYNEDDCLFLYRCVGDSYKVCIAYEGNEHLLGTYKYPE
nr:MAG TPA: hypothetical protein [Caudoviricetes sp.]